MSANIRANWRRPAFVLTFGVLACALSVAPWTLAGQQDAKAKGEGRTQAEPKTADKKESNENAMQVFYLEVVTKEVEQVVAAYSSATGVTFGKPDAGLGGARTAPMAGGGMVGVRAPMRETEAPIVRPYWLVKDIKAAVAAAQKAGGQLAMEPTLIPGHGTFAIYVQGGVDHGLWQK